MGKVTVTEIRRMEGGGYRWTVIDPDEYATWTPMVWHTNHAGRGLWWGEGWEHQREGTLQFDLNCSASSRRRRVSKYFGTEEI